ncbi:MAG: hemerythrin domain-containing protein [Chromatiaceae bacterium]
MFSLEGWTEDCSVGNEVVDRMHKLLLETAQQAVDSLNIEDHEILRTKLTELVDTYDLLTYKHIEKEECILATNKCPNLATHHEMHLKGLKVLRKIFHKLLVSTTITYEDKEKIYKYFHDWRCYHVIQDDMADFEYFRDKNQTDNF